MLAGVISGELYNAKELETELVRMGHSLFLKTDAELILHAYAAWGDDFVTHLNGIFSLAITDGERVIAARDRLGIEPLFYSHTASGAVFASEMKGVMAFRGVTPTMDQQGLLELIAIGPAHTPGKTPLRDIQELPGGHLLILKGRECAVRCV